MTTTPDFSGYTPTWCPGCGDWGIHAAIKQAFTQMQMNPSNMIVVFGVGCSGNMNDFLNAYALHSLHGRAVPNALGIKIANHELPVFVIAGDGDTYGEGLNHFIHACRGNHDVTIIVHDNGVYGLTTGQSAPTAQKGYRSPSTPDGIVDVPVNPLSIAIANGATFVGQGFAGNIPHLINVVKQGTQHKGFSLINILQPCVTFNKINTYSYYREHVYTLEEEYDKTNTKEALKRSLEMTHEEKFALGVLYEVDRPVFTDQLPQLSQGSLISRQNNLDGLLDAFT